MEPGEGRLEFDTDEEKRERLDVEDKGEELEDDEAYHKHTKGEVDIKEYL